MIEKRIMERKKTKKGWIDRRKNMEKKTKEKYIL